MTKLLIAGLSFIYLVNIAQGWGLILFVPEVYQLENVKGGINAEGCHGVFGDDLLKMTAISGKKENRRYSFRDLG